MVNFDVFVLVRHELYAIYVGEIVAAVYAHVLLIAFHSFRQTVGLSAQSDLFLFEENSCITQKSRITMMSDKVIMHV